MKSLFLRLPPLQVREEIWLILFQFNTSKILKKQRLSSDSLHNSLDTKYKSYTSIRRKKRRGIRNQPFGCSQESSKIVQLGTQIFYIWIWAASSRISSDWWEVGHRVTKKLRNSSSRGSRRCQQWRRWWSDRRGTIQWCRRHRRLASVCLFMLFLRLWQYGRWHWNFSMWCNLFNRLFVQSPSSVLCLPKVSQEL